MRRSTLGILGLVAFLEITRVASGAVIPGSQFRYNNCGGVGFTDDKSGKLSYCAVGGRFLNGISMNFAVQATGARSL
jgi:hypothetical protein